MRKEINEVFTPRRSAVNEAVYVPRQDLEDELLRAMVGSKHVLLYGESGIGKSWLYKKLFSELGINTVIGNCARAALKGSLIEEIRSICISPNTPKKTGYVEEKKAGVDTILSASLSHQASFMLAPCDDLFEAFESLAANNDSKKYPSILVLDNMEALPANESIMQELANILLLLDDDLFSTAPVKILLVGLPNQVMDFFDAIKNITSVGNRLDELPSLRPFDFSEVRELVEKGYTNLLQVELTETEILSISSHAEYITLGVPERVHEYCELLAYEIKNNNWVYDGSMLYRADEEWLARGLKKSWAIIDRYFNSDDTVVRRRNQVLYALGATRTNEVDTNSIGKIIRREFPNKSPESNSGVGQILKYLCSGESPILRKNNHNANYCFVDPRYVSCLRLLVQKTGDNLVKAKFALGA